jgi:GntR family transcriptional regulator
MVPVFQQLRSQIDRLITSGQLRPGVKLPAIRQLAIDLGIARGTVNKVYDALARDGLVHASGRHGTVVLAVANRPIKTADLDAAADALAVIVRQLGLSDDQAHRALDEAVERLDLTG